MRLLFGKKKEAPKPIETMEKLKNQIDLLYKKCDFLQMKIQNEVKTAKINLKTNKTGKLNKKTFCLN